MKHTVKILALLIAIGLSGCASTKDLDMTRSQVEKANATAEMALQTANEAKATANDAKAIAEDAKATSATTESKLDQMFKKAMYKYVHGCLCERPAVFKRGLPRPLARRSSPPCSKLKAICNKSCYGHRHAVLFLQCFFYRFYIQYCILVFNCIKDHLIGFTGHVLIFTQVFIQLRMNL